MSLKANYKGYITESELLGYWPRNFIHFLWLYVVRRCRWVYP